jgi:glycosyltransferase involved in cell wall biosynthesis
MIDVSLCIPCGAKHVKYLPAALNSVLTAPVLPDEIIVSVSGCEDQELVRSILSSVSFPRSLVLKTFIYPEQRTAGRNRNDLAEKASCSIISFVDADDWSHPQRVSTIKNIFLSDGIVHLNHGLTLCPPHPYDSFRSTKYDSVEIIDLKPAREFLAKIGSPRLMGGYGNFERVPGCRNDFGVHNGAVTVHKDVFKKVKFKESRRDWIIAEDQDFNYEVMFRFNKSVLCRNSLYLYNLSDRLNGGY